MAAFKRYIVCAFYLLTLLGAVKAQQDNNGKADTIPVLKEVHITATRKAADLLSTPYSVNTLSQKEREAFQYRTTPEALAGSAGIFIQKTNHGGGSPFIRGLTGNQTLVLIDGVRFNNATFRYGPNQYLNTIDPFTVGKIEVVRGSGSVQYGSDALGGVIQLFTKEPAFSEKKTWHGSVIGKITTQDMEYTGRGELQYQSSGLSVMAGYSRRKFGDLYGGDTTGKQSPSGYEEQAFDIKLKAKLTERIGITAAHQYLQQDDVPLYHRVKLEDFEYYLFAPQRRTFTYARLDVDGKNKWANKISFLTSLQHSREQRKYRKNNNVNRFLEDDKVQTFGTSMEISSVIANGWTANSGIEYYRDRVNSGKQQVTVAGGSIIRQRGLYPDDATSGNLSVYSLHHFARGKWEYEAGLRYNHFSISIPDTGTSALKLGDVRVTPSSLVSNAAILYHLNERQSVYTSFSTGYRAPNIDDMGTLGLVDFRYELPAYDLKPEKTYHGELGYRFRNRNLQWSAALFYMRLTNLITRTQVAGQQIGGYNVYKKENSQQSYLYGADISFQYQLGKNWLLNANGSYTYGQNKTANEPMRRIPPVNGRALLMYQRGQWNFSLESMVAGKQDRLAKGDMDDNRIPKGGTPGWEVWNLYGEYHVSIVTLRLAFHNLLNEDYRTHGSGLNGMGRSASMSIRINW